MEETANHSGIEQAEPVIEQAPVTETVESQATGETATPAEEPRGIKVKYNKEERFVPEDEVPNWVQKGLNYDKVSEKAQQAERYQQSLDRVAKYYGFDDHESYMTALEEAERDQQLSREAEQLGDKLGISADVMKEVIREYVDPLKTELSQVKQTNQSWEEERALQKVESQITSMESDTANYPDFAQHKMEVINLAAAKGYSLEDAYKILTYDTRVTNASQQAQQEAIRRLQQNADSSTGALGADAPEQATGYLAMSQAERKAFREANKRGQPY